MTLKSTTTQNVEVTYLAELGPASVCRITIPEGTRVSLQHDGRGLPFWVVDDVPLLVRLTGNEWDPQYRYCKVPANVVKTIKP